MKATTVVFSSEVCSSFTAMSSRTLMSDHVPKMVHAFLCFQLTRTWIDFPKCHLLLRTPESGHSLRGEWHGRNRFEESLRYPRSKNMPATARGIITRCSTKDTLSLQLRASTYNSTSVETSSERQAIIYHRNLNYPNDTVHFHHL